MAKAASKTPRQVVKTRAAAVTDDGAAAKVAEEAAARAAEEAAAKAAEEAAAVKAAEEDAAAKAAEEAAAARAAEEAAAAKAAEEAAAAQAAEEAAAAKAAEEAAADADDEAAVEDDGNGVAWETTIDAEAERVVDFAEELASRDLDGALAHLDGEIAGAVRMREACIRIEKRLRAGHKRLSRSETIWPLEVIHYDGEQRPIGEPCAVDRDTARDLLTRGIATDVAPTDEPDDD